MTRQWPAFWSRTGGLATLLRPLEWLFRQAAAWRRRRLQRNPPFIAAPVVVVGNLIVGGSGKTPLVIWLVDRAAARGWRPGVVMRGYGGHAKGIERVGPETDPERVGDEAVLIARRTDVPVMVGRDRPAAARALVSGEGVEVAVVDLQLECHVIRVLPRGGDVQHRHARLLEVVAAGGGVDEIKRRVGVHLEQSVRHRRILARRGEVGVGSRLGGLDRGTVRRRPQSSAGAGGLASSPSSSA